MTYFELLERRNRLVGDLMGWELASDRGDIDAEGEAHLAAMKRELEDVDRQALAAWDARSAEAIADWDAVVVRVIERMHATGGRLDGFDVQSLEPRAQATQSSKRTFDAWAIWAVLRLDTP